MRRRWTHPACLPAHRASAVPSWPKPPAAPTLSSVARSANSSPGGGRPGPLTHTLTHSHTLTHTLLQPSLPCPAQHCTRRPHHIRPAYPVPGPLDWTGQATGVDHAESQEGGGRGIAASSCSWSSTSTVPRAPSPHSHEPHLHSLHFFYSESEPARNRMEWNQIKSIRPARPGPARPGTIRPEARRRLCGL